MSDWFFHLSTFPINFAKDIFTIILDFKWLASVSFCWCIVDNLNISWSIAYAMSVYLFFITKYIWFWKLVKILRRWDLFYAIKYSTNTLYYLKSALKYVIFAKCQQFYYTHLFNIIRRMQRWNKSDRLKAFRIGLYLFRISPYSIGSITLSIYMCNHIPK